MNNYKYVAITSDKSGSSFNPVLCKTEQDANDCIKRASEHASNFTADQQKCVDNSFIQTIEEYKEGFHDFTADEIEEVMQKLDRV